MRLSHATEREHERMNTYQPDGLELPLLGVLGIRQLARSRRRCVAIRRAKPWDLAALLLDRREQRRLESALGAAAEGRELRTPHCHRCTLGWRFGFGVGISRELVGFDGIR